ncbi:DNA modification methylase [Parasphingorhabdus marina DSM 22363]|uniref:Methyltransferase n=1 Tax=Parasphingorhabdus marina DSM 22363 TaxID=1123272 RepID=A0A1N6DA98_9SPHN|nr:DNA methyltransferase [Parasphingorhabdus marina]SIN67730.1 DNA modification methylase [Parasphingorhabdus marina DSM 22363]
MNDLEVTYLTPDEIKPRVHAYRKHSDHQINLIAKSIQTNGMIDPLLVDANNRIVCGEAVIEAAKKIRLNRVPVIRIEHLSEAKLRAYGLAANKLAELSGYDEDILALELADINQLLDDPDLTDLGFETADLDRIMGLTVVEAERVAALPVNIDSANIVTKPGDLWGLGKHKLYCGDAKDETSYARLMGEDRAQLTPADVPYNVRVADISGLGKHKHKEFIEGSGELSSNEFARFLTLSMRLMRGYSADGSLHMVFMSWPHLLELLRAGKIVFDELKNIITWVKSNGGMGSLYRSQTEFVALFKNGTAPHVNNIELGRHGRNRSNAWHYDGLNSFVADRDELLAMHPTIKPLEMIKDAILDCSNQNDIILDPFVGSGTTIVACEQVRRRCRAIELDPLYVDASLRRFIQVTGVEPTHLPSGQSFSEREAAVPQPILESSMEVAN